ncbi:hypothetical protein NFI96_030844, partial [Prochilodus magdalenae]
MPRMRFKLREKETLFHSVVELLLYESLTALVLVDLQGDGSFCLVCINTCWDQDDLKGEYTCPQCKGSIKPRPVLSKNVMLAEMMEKLKLSAGGESVECDVCIGRKFRAEKSCLVCLASYCETHLQPHHQSPAFKKHKLVKASRRLQEQICSEHEKRLQVYCRTDQQCICMLCTMDYHRGHDTVSAAAERAERQRKLVDTKRQFQQRTQEKEKEVQELNNTLESYKRSARTAVQDTERILTELISSIERRRSEVLQLIRDQEEAAAGRVEGVLKRLEEEISELRRRNTELEQLSLTEDHIHFLQSFQSLSVPPGLTSIIFSPNNSFKEVLDSVSQLRVKVEQLCEEESGKISNGGKIYRCSPPEIIRCEKLQILLIIVDAADLTLDPNTVNKELSLSERNRKVERVGEDQLYPDHPDRFDSWPQALSVESLNGRCYWEVLWDGVADISVSYRGIRRKGYSDGQLCSREQYTV